MKKLMKKGKLIIYWDYELQKGADVSTLNYHDGIEDYHQTDFILRHLNKYEIKTCFAVLGCAAQKGDLPYHSPEQIREMAENGHEVGSHTFNHKRISQITFAELMYELEKSKATIEKTSKEKCTAFVAPWDKPQYFFGKAIDFMPGSIIPKPSKLNFSQICLALDKTGYKTYRICPLTSRFNKTKLSIPFDNKNITCVPCYLSNGFGIDAKRLIKRAAEKRGLAVIYAHPRGLAHPGEQNKNNFKMLIDFIQKYKTQKKLDIITPEELSRIIVTNR